LCFHGGAEAVKLRVAHLSLLPPPGTPAGSGVPKVAETLLREFENTPELEVEAIALMDGAKEEVQEVRGNVRYHYIPCKARGKTATFYWRETRLLRGRVASLGVAIVHGQPSSEYLLAATSCDLPHVITIHGLVSREMAGLSRLNPVSWAMVIRERLQRRSAARAANIISISPYVTAYLDGWHHARIWPIANPIDEEFFTLPPPAREGLRILCVGLVSDRKNQALLVESCRRLAAVGIQFECRIVGKSLPGADASLEEQIRSGRLTQQVRLTGMISRKELAEQYTWANVVALPSREETSPLSLIQGMASGRCVLGASAAGIPSLLDNGAYGSLFPPEDAQALAEVLRDLAKNPDGYWERAAAAKKHAHATFRPEAVARRTVEVYRAISRELKS
jgi:glycosyltransferase involved in cell wall biosynthesis